MTEERAVELGCDPTPRFTVLENPNNLTNQGVLLPGALKRREDTDRETVLCFHSNTALLQYVSPERAYQFLHPFTTEVREFDARAHYHINSRAHDERQVETLMTLFDGVREPAEA